MPFMPGLVIHPSPNIPRARALINITHEQSGLSILQHIPERKLNEIRWLLFKLAWDTSIEVIANSSPHFIAVKRVVRMSKQKRSKKQEDKIAKDLGGKRQPGSGCRWGYRRDVINKQLLVEAKITEKSKFSISGRDLLFLRKQAYLIGKIPVYAVSLCNRSEIIVIPEQDVDPDFLEQTPKIEFKTKKNSWTLTLNHLEIVDKNEIVVFNIQSDRYVLLSYDDFLDQYKQDK